MSVETDTRDRVIRLETSLQHLRDDFDETKQKVEEIYELLVKARGAKWLWIVSMTCAGAFGSGLAYILKFFAITVH